MNDGLTIKFIPIGNKKTVEGIPKDVAIRFGGLEMTVHINGLTSWDDGKPSDEQRQYLTKNLEDGQQLISIIQKLIKNFKHDNVTEMNPKIYILGFTKKFSSYKEAFSFRQKMKSRALIFEYLSPEMTRRFLESQTKRNRT